MPPKTDKNADKRELILNAAMDLLAERGFHNTPMSLIAKEAGVAAGTIYHYFASKEDMINQLYLELKMELAKKLLDDIKIGHTIRQVFEMCWYNVYGFFREKPAYFKFYEQFRNSPFIHGATRKQGEAMFKDMDALMERGLKEGVLKCYPEPLFIALWMGPLTELLNQERQAGEPFGNDILKIAEAACWRSISE